MIHLTPALSVVRKVTSRVSTELFMISNRNDFPESIQIDSKHKFGDLFVASHSDDLQYEINTEDNVRLVAHLESMNRSHYAIMTMAYVRGTFQSHKWTKQGEISLPISFNDLKQELKKAFDKQMDQFNSKAGSKVTARRSSEDKDIKSIEDLPSSLEIKGVRCKKKITKPTFLRTVRYDHPSGMKIITISQEGVVWFNDDQDYKEGGLNFPVHSTNINFPISKADLIKALNDNHLEFEIKARVSAEPEDGIYAKAFNDTSLTLGNKQFRISVDDRLYRVYREVIKSKLSDRYVLTLAFYNSQRISMARLDREVYNDLHGHHILDAGFKAVIEFDRETFNDAIAEIQIDGKLISSYKDVLNFDNVAKLKTFLSDQIEKYIKTRRAKK